MKDFKLDQHPRIDSGFKVPDGYFEDFSSRMKQNLPSASPKVIRLDSRRHAWLAAAAALVVGLTIPALDRLVGTVSDTEKASATESYLAYQSGLTTDDIAEAMTMEDVQSIQIPFDVDPTQLEEAVSQTNNIENYID